MIEAAGITLRESIEAILVIFIMVAYLKKTSAAHKKKYVYSGALMAVGASIALALILSGIGINPENEFVEGILFFTAGILVAGLTLWMMRHARHFKSEIENQLGKASSTLALFGIAFIMVFREGAETVIFLQSLLLRGTSPAESFLGGVLGIGLAVLFGGVFLRGTAKINLRRFFRVTAAILIVLAIELVANGFHEFFELRVLPSTESLMTVVGFLAKDSTGASIIALMLLAIAGTVLYDLIQASGPQVTNLSPAERRKAKYDFLKEKYMKVGLASVITALMVTLLTPAIIASDVAVPTPVSIQAEHEVLTIPVTRQDGLHRYAFDDKRVMVAVQDSQPHVALDYCYICPPSGYGYDGERLVCLNCAAPIEISTVGNPGGCNPRVLEYEIGDDSVHVSVEAVEIAWGK